MTKTLLLGRKRTELVALILIFTFMAIEQAQAPTYKMMTLRVRQTAYSPKQPRESDRNHKMKKIRNEIGVAIPKQLMKLIPDGSVVYTDDDVRVADDRYGAKGASRFGGNCIDLRYFQSIKSKPKTKAVNRELRRRFDNGWGNIKVKSNIPE